MGGIMISSDYSEKLQESAAKVLQALHLQDNSETLTKMELIKLLCEKLRFDIKTAREFVDAFFAEIISTLASGEPVKLTGFGSFELRDKRSRPGRNPKTNEEVLITARRVVLFHASGKLKKASNLRKLDQKTTRKFKESDLLPQT